MAEPWKKYQQPGNPYAVSGGPRQPTPRYPDEAAKGQADAALATAQTQMIPVQQDKLRADAALAQAQAGQIGQTDDAVKYKQKRANLDALVNQINRVEELYRQTIEPTSGMSGFLDFLPTEGNRQFDAAGAGLAEQGLAAFRVPGVGAQSDTELRQFVAANKPSASDYDATIEEKMRQLRGRVDATREQLGLPPAEWGGQPQEKADASTVFYGNPTQGNQEQIAGGSTRTVVNPADVGINARVNAMLKRGDSDLQIIRYLQSAGADPNADPKLAVSLRQALDWRRKNPKFKGDYSLNLERAMEVPNSAQAQESAGPLGAYMSHGANAASLGTLDNMTEDPERTRAALGELSRRNPGSSLAGSVTGGALAAAGGEFVAGRLGLQGAKAALAGDAAFGAGYGAGSADDGNRLMGAVTGAGAGLAGGVVGRKAAAGVGRALTGTRDAATRLLAERGVPMTVGQIASRGGLPGKGLKKMEDALMSVPILGAAIQARRAEGTQGFNAAAFREAGAPINAPAGGIAEEGVEAGQAATKDAYRNALSGVQVAADKTFVRDMKRAMAAGQRLHPEVAEDFGRIVQNEVAGELASGRLTGEGYQALRQALRQERAAWKGKPRGHQYGQALRQVEGALESLVRRKAPGVVDSLNRADRAYGLGKVVESAVGKGANTGGIFTPAQLGMAARQSGNKYGGTGSTTARPFFDLQRAGQDILPSQVPNSGTADRLMGAGLIPALAGAGAAGQQAGFIDPSTAGIMVAMGLPFTKAGQATFQRLLVQRPELVRSVGQQVLARKGAGGLFGAGAGVSLTGE